MDDITVVVEYQQKGDTGPQGPAGDSAYQIAVDNGFQGTEAEWLLSLQGKDGTGGGGSGGTIDTYPTVNSTNAVSSGGVYIRLQDKVDKATTVNGKALTGNISLDKTDLALTNVDNTADINKIVSTPQQAVFDIKANITDVAAQDAAVVSQILGSVTTDGNTLKKLNDKISGLLSFINGDDINLDTIKELADAIKNDISLITALGTSKFDKADVYNALDYIIAGKALDARQGKVLNDLIVANSSAIASNTTAIATKADATATTAALANKADAAATTSALALKADLTALNTKADLAGGKVPDAQLPTRTFGSSFYTYGTPDPVLQVIDPLVEAWQYLGSTIKGWVIGMSPYMAASSALTLSSGFYYPGMIRVFGSQTLTGVSWMLAAAGTGITSNNENRIGLYTYNKAGLLTLVASTANNAALYTQTAGLQLQEAFTTPYMAADGFYWLNFIYSSSAQTIAPALAASTFSLPNKVAPLTTNSAKVQSRSLSGTKTSLPSSITFSTDTTTVNNGFLAGVY